MRTQLIRLTAILGLVAVAPPAVADPVISGQDDRRGLDLTVYNQDLALVREVRRLEVPEGLFTCEFRDVPSRIDPVTLLVAGGGRTGFTVLEQNYEFDLLSPDRILGKYVGREIAWIQEDGSRISGRLLGTNSGPVYEVDGEILFEMPGRLALPSLPENLRARPTLVWNAATERSGSADLEVSYLTRGISWKADYVLELDAAGRKAGLQAWVSVDNRSGATYDDANLLLVAGDINQARPQRVLMAEMSDFAKTTAAPAFTEESLYDYHLYTLQRPTTVKDNQIKQISLFETAGVGVEKVYTLSGQARLFRGGGPLRTEPAVEVSYRFANTEDNNLGMPLPAGIFRVYGQSAAGSRQLLGEDRIGHTPRKETVELTVGRAFDIVAERARTESRRIADNVYRNTFEITLRNHRDEDVVVQVVENVGGDWEVLNSTVGPEKKDAATLVFAVPVPADGETILTYTVQSTY